MEPLKSAHADRTYSIPGADHRFTIKRHLCDYSYPQNGNVHNPTPRYRWLLLVDGRQVDSAEYKRVLVAAVRSNGAAYLD